MTNDNPNASKASTNILKIIIDAKAGHDAFGGLDLDQLRAALQGLVEIDLVDGDSLPCDADMYLEILEVGITVKEESYLRRHFSENEPEKPRVILLENASNALSLKLVDALRGEEGVSVSLDAEDDYLPHHDVLRILEFHEPDMAGLEALGRYLKRFDIRSDFEAHTKSPPVKLPKVSAMSRMSEQVKQRGITNKRGLSHRR